MPEKIEKEHGGSVNVQPLVSRQITLGELLDSPNTPDDKFGMGTYVGNKIIENIKILRTDSLFHAYKSLMQNLPAIASERALTSNWKEHPMFGIASESCDDKWAKAYQQIYNMMNKIADEILTRLAC